MTAASGSNLARIMAAFAFVVSSGTLATAQPKADVVRLANGDRVTGEIVNVNRGRLELSTDDAGTIEFEWDNIASVESTRQFDIETSDGRRLLGALQPAVGRFMRIVTSAGGDATS